MWGRRPRRSRGPDTRERSRARRPGGCAAARADRRARRPRRRCRPAAAAPHGDGARDRARGRHPRRLGDRGSTYQSARCASREDMPNHTPPPLAGVTALVTTGPTREPIDPVRYISNRSSGKTGLAIARSLVEAGARTIVVCGPTTEPAPAGVELLLVETAAEMREACAAALPVDVAVCVAAVADWRVRQASAEKLHQVGGRDDPGVGRQPRHPARAEPSRSAAAAARRRLRRRDRPGGRACRCQAAPQGLRLDRREQPGRARRLRRRGQPRGADHGRGCRVVAAHGQDRDRRPARRSNRRPRH